MSCKILSVPATVSSEGKSQAWETNCCSLPAAPFSYPEFDLGLLCVFAAKLGLVLEARSQRSGCQYGRVPVRTLFRVADGCFLVVLVVGVGRERGRERLDIARFTYPFSGCVGCFQLGLL